MLMKLIHQDFYTYTDFFFLVSLPKALLLKRNIFLSFKDKERPLFNAKYYTENFAKLLKDNQMFQLKSRGYNARVPFTDVQAMECHGLNLSV